MKFVISIEKDGRYLVRRAGFLNCLFGGGFSCALSRQISEALLNAGMPINEFEKNYLKEEQELLSYSIDEAVVQVQRGHKLQLVKG